MKKIMMNFNNGKEIVFKIIAVCIPTQIYLSGTREENIFSLKTLHIAYGTKFDSLISC